MGITFVKVLLLISKSFFILHFVFLHSLKLQIALTISFDPKSWNYYIFSLNDNAAFLSYY